MSRFARVFTIGETMGLAANDRVGPLYTSAPHTLSFGGAESNVAIALSRLGVPATWISRLGDDPLGRLIAKSLRAEGVEQQVVIDAERPTGFMLKSRRSREAATVTFWRDGSAASAISPHDIAELELTSADALHLTGILPGLSSSASECALRAVRRAKDAGAFVSWDVNHRAKVWKNRDPSATYRELLTSADVVFANADEAASIVGAADSPLDLARKLTAVGPRQAVVKLGSKGAVADIEGVPHTQAPHDVDAIDPVGAGDAFVAGYLSGIHDDSPPQQRLQRAAICGALACSVIGDWEGSPTLNEVATVFAQEQIHR